MSIVFQALASVIAAVLDPWCLTFLIEYNLKSDEFLPN